MADGTSFSSNEPHVGGYIVYINGIEVPTKRVSQRHGVWQIPEMQIEMVADPVLHRLGAEDRVQVTIFWLDDTSPDPSIKPALRLWGEGEISGWGYVNSKFGRTISFVCINQFAIFKSLFFQFLLNSDDMLSQLTFAGHDTATATTITSQLSFPFSLFRSGLVQAPQQTAPNDAPAGSDPSLITRPFDFLYNVVKGMVGAVPPSQQAVPATNFFARWARLTNFVNRFAALPVFDETSPTLADGTAPTPNGNVFPILKALQTASAVDVVARSLIAHVQNQDSLWGMFQLVYQTMFMEIAMVPAMPLVTVDLATSVVQPTSFSGRTATSPINPLKPNRLQNYFAKPQFLFGLPPACNVFFPSQVIRLSYSEDYWSQPTRIYFNDEVLPRVAKTAQSGIGDPIQNFLTRAYPPEVDAVVQARKGNPNLNGKNFLLFPEEFYKGPVMDRRPIPTWLFFLAQAQYKAEQDQEKADATVPESLKPSVNGGQQPDAVAAAQLANPDVYDLYTQYEFFRERYAKRGGSAEVSWQPYAVPGLPGAIFDQRGTRLDLFMYITTIQQEMTHRSRQQTITFAYARTVQEMFSLLADEFANKTAPAPIGAAPVEVIGDVSNVIQKFANAESFYQKLFYGARSLFGKPASFDWRNILAYAPKVSGQQPEAIHIDTSTAGDVKKFQDAQETIANLKPQIDDLNAFLADLQAQLEIEKNGLKVAQAQAGNVPPPTIAISIAAFQKDIANLETQIQQAGQLLAQKSTEYNQALGVVNGNTLGKITHNLDGTREVVPAPGAEKYFSNYDDAVVYNWRPICTLDEYVLFYGAKGEDPVPAFGHPQSIGVPYYRRIRRLTPLTADTVLPKGADGLDANTTPNSSAASQGAPQAGTGDTSTPSGTVQTVPGLPPTFPQTRDDWDSILLEYRDRVYNDLIPRT